MKTHRYFVDELPLDQGSVRLDDYETHHALNVLRIRVGDSVTLFDGKNHEAEAVVTKAGKREVLCQATAQRHVDRENRVALSLGVAMPKGDRAKELVERLTELGVETLIPLQCKHTPWATTENAVAKWQRVVIDACKQSGRNRLMSIEPPSSLEAFLSRFTTGLRIILHPHETDSSIAIATLLSRSIPTLVVAVGPEGGFAAEEIWSAEAIGWQAISLGERRYRIETAATMVAAQVALL